jgi:hypothetical protein
MKKTIIISLCLLALVAGGVYWKQHPKSAADANGPLVVASPGAGGPYKNETFGFTIILPKGVSMTNLEGADDGSTTLIAQGTPQFQIYIAPFDDDIVLTAKKIRDELPDMKLSKEQEVSTSGGAVKGVAFDSEDELFVIWCL